MTIQQFDSVHFVGQLTPRFVVTWSIPQVELPCVESSVSRGGAERSIVVLSRGSDDAMLTSMDSNERRFG